MRVAAAYALAVCAALGILIARTRADEAPADGRIVKMPPFPVFENGTWHYVLTEEVEVISRASVTETADFLGHYLFQKRMLEELLPAQLQPPQETPVEMVLINPDMERRMNDALAATMRTQSLHQLPLDDTDGASTSVLLTLKNDDYSGLQTHPNRVKTLLSKRHPALPQWFQAWVTETFQQIDWLDEREITIPTSRWTSGDSHFIPFEEVFADTIPSSENRRRTKLRDAQRWLFFHWAMAEHRVALWTFVEQASMRPVTEEMFSDCFGLSYAELQKTLIAYIPLLRPIVIARVSDTRVPAFTFREATDQEVAKVEGDLIRKEIHYVKSIRSDRAATARYIEHASRVLLASFDIEESYTGYDPGFLAVVGLYYAELNDTRKAIPALSKAVEGHTPRTLAYIELARMRYEQAAELPLGGGGGFSRAQVESILASIKSWPKALTNLAAYDIASRTLYRLADPPTDEDLAIFDEGLRTFPKNPAIILAAASLYGRAHNDVRAQQLVDLGLEIVSDKALREKFIALRIQIAASSVGRN